MKKETNNSEERKRTAVAILKVAIALALLLGGLNLFGYVALSSIAKMICGGVSGLVGIYTLVTNMR